MDGTNLVAPPVGDNALRILTPTLLELRQINTKAPDPALVSSWNVVSSGGQFTANTAGKFAVTVGGQPATVQSVGFRRRVSYASLNTYDLRIDNALYLTLASPVADGQTVVVTNPDGTVWSSATVFSLSANPLRYSPAIHVNQEGYVPTLPKKAMVGYYLGDMGEMPMAATSFSVIDVTTNASVFQGTLTLRQDSGYETTPLPYQQVYVADFSSFTTPGEYQIQVQGMGTSLPFVINEGIAMAWVRTYALGMYEQRSGTSIGLPFTRFAHSPDHTAPASIPVPDTSPSFAQTWSCINSYTSQLTPNSPPLQQPQTAPALTSNETSLYPFVNTGTVNVSGGHWDAGDYSKYTENSAQLIHELVFAVDNMPGVSSLDNLGIPESGDGIPDALQEAKWEADFLLKMQDADGGFYFLVYPISEEYENVLPQNGSAQVVWPKNTSVSAASTAALAEAGSSPVMVKYYPVQAAAYLAAAQKGWAFLQAATAKYGASRYQKLTFYSDDWQDLDEYAWAAAALYAATGSAAYQTQLFALFPNPADSSTFRWGWWSMAEGWGNAVRDYAFAAASGRLPASALDPAYLAACQGQVVAAGDNVVAWAASNAYGTPFPPQTKAVLGGGWYFSLDQASDAAIAYLVTPNPAFIDALVSALNYEGGTNPVNVAYLTGLGLKRQHNIVDQFAVNSRRALPPSGIPLGQVTAAFEYLSSYGPELSELSYPTDSGSAKPYPYYDRWSDAYNVTQEFITVNQARSFLASALLASLTTSESGAWVAPAASITVPASIVPLNAPVTLTLQVPGLDLTGARIVWEGRDQQPAFGSTYTFTPVEQRRPVGGGRGRVAGRPPRLRGERLPVQQPEPGLGGQRPAGRSLAGLRRRRRLELGVLKPCSAVRHPRGPDGHRGGHPRDLVHGRHRRRHAGLDRRHAVRLGLHRPGEPSHGNHGGLERRLVLGTPRLLGREQHPLWHQRDGGPHLCRPPAGGGGLGGTGRAGERRGPGRFERQRARPLALRRPSHLEHGRADLDGPLILHARGRDRKPAIASLRSQTKRLPHPRHPQRSILPCKG